MILLLFLAVAAAQRCTNAPAVQFSINTTGCTYIEWELDSVLPLNVFDASAPTITTIDLTWMAAIPLPVNQFNTPYPVLTTLNLHGSFLTILHPGTFKFLTALLALWIDGTGISILGSEDIAEPTLFANDMAITRFKLTDNLQLYPNSYTNMFVHLINLTTLEIRNSIYDGIPFNALAPLEKLTTLDISQNTMVGIYVSLLEHTQLLEVFNSSYNPFKLGYMEQVRTMFSRTSVLRVIDMSSNTLAMLPIIPESVTYLNVASNLISDLSGISGNIIHLDISANPITSIFGVTANLLTLVILSNSLAGINVSGFNILGKNASVIIDIGACINFPVPYPVCTFIRGGIRLNATDIICPIPRIRDPSIPIAIVAGVAVAVVVPLIITIVLMCKL